MLLLPAPTAGLAGAASRFKRASKTFARKVSQAASDENESEPVAAIAEMSDAKRQFSASLVTSCIADEMLNALIELNIDPTLD